MISTPQQAWFLTQYRAHPCRTLPNAYWKTARHAAALQLERAWDEAQNLTSLAIWKSDHLLAFWCANPEQHSLPEGQMAAASLALVHAEGLLAFSGQTFKRREAYFRIIHKGAPQDYNCPPGFALAAVNPAAESKSVAMLIQACYPQMQMDADTISSWTTHPVYEPSLWIWAVDLAQQVPVGLGIAELDAEVSEASLEWIQVLPTYRGRGLGKAIVAELLRRVAGRAAFTTVSGQVDNRTRPEQVYRQCGFTGSDVWWLLTRT